MSYLVTSPDALASTATQVERIGSALRAAGANAAAPTTGLASAAEDEVSAAIAELFGAVGRDYQAVLTQAEAFHGQFTQALAAAGAEYAQAETAGAALLGQTANAPLTAV